MKIRDRAADSFYSSDMQKAAFAVVLGMLICAGCEKAPHPEQARGHSLADLVFAANAPVFDAGGIPYVEAVWIDGIWKIHDGGVWRADCRSDDEIYKAMDEIWEKRQDSRILISAGGGTAFRDISQVVRNSVRAGFRRLDFLVATGVPSPANHSIRLKLAPVDHGMQPDIEPFIIVLDAQGAIYTGIGPGQILHDTDTTDHALPKLNNMLEMFSSAARSTGSRPFLQVHADPAVSYQRVIDVFAQLYKHRIKDIMFTDLNPSMDDNPIKRPESHKTKPRPPSSPLPSNE